MNILLLGIADSVFIRDYCKYVLYGKDIKTAVLSQQPGKRYADDYRSLNIRTINWPEFFVKGIRSQMLVFPLIIKKWKELKKEIGFGNHIDVLHIHYVEPMHLIYFIPFWLKAKKRVLTFWGSDLFSASKKKLRLFPYFLKHSTSIVFMIQNQCDYFQGIFGHKYDDKIRIIDFGNSLLKTIDNSILNDPGSHCKKYFGFPEDKIIVHVGYNAFRGQQHDKILKAIAGLPGEMLQKIKLVLHISYGQEDGFKTYFQSLKDIMDAAGIDYIFIDSYLQGEELAKFRRTCDLFIYGQATDARSASPLEYIYAGARFVCPKWLANHYEVLDQAGIKYYKYDNFNTLCDTLQLCLKEFNSHECLIGEQGRKKIYEEISWDCLAEKWRNLYE